MPDFQPMTLLLIPVTLAVVFLLWVLWKVEIDIRRTRSLSQTPCSRESRNITLRTSASTANWPSARGSRALSR